MITGLLSRVAKLERNGGANCQCQPPIVIRGAGDMHGPEPEPASTLCDRCGLGRLVVFVEYDEHFFNNNAHQLMRERERQGGQPSPA